MFGSIIFDNSEGMEINARNCNTLKINEIDAQFIIDVIFIPQVSMMLPKVASIIS